MNNLYNCTMTKLCLLIVLLSTSWSTFESRPWRSFNIIQKSVGITIHDADPLTTTPTTSRLGSDAQPFAISTESNNETETNQTKMIENVLNTVVQSSMNDMLLKLTNSLGDLFSMFNAGRHQRKQMKDEIEARLSSGNTIESLQLESSVTSKLDTNSGEKTRDESTFRNNAVIDDDEDDMNFDRQTDQDQNKLWWRNILMKILTKNKNQHLLNDIVVLSTTVSPKTAWSAMPDVFDVVHGISDKHVFDSVSHKIIDKPEIQNFTDEFQISATPLEVENDSQAINENNLSFVPTFVPTVERVSIAPVWELLIRLDNGLEGVLKNQSISSLPTTLRPDVPADQISLDSMISMPDPAEKSVLITGDPDIVMSTKRITPLPNRPIIKSNNLFLQTVIVSCAAVFAIFVFSCFGIALVCFGKKRNNRRANLGGLPRFDPATGAGIFGRPIFKTSSNAPYYYDSSARSDWSLMSRDRDRQVETYFASASILDTSCDSSPSTNSHPVSVPSATAILH